MPTFTAKCIIFFRQLYLSPREKKKAGENCYSRPAEKEKSVNFLLCSCGRTVPYSPSPFPCFQKSREGKSIKRRGKKEGVGTYQKKTRSAGCVVRCCCVFYRTQVTINDGAVKNVFSTSNIPTPEAALGIHGTMHKGRIRRHRQQLCHGRVTRKQS